MLGGEQQKGTYNALWAYRMNNVTAAVPQIDVGSRNPEDKDNGGTGAESAYINYLGRLNYDFKSKYLFEFVFRYDGSSIFPDENRFGFFPAVSAGWRLSEENFISGNLPFVNELKLRASYGELGNDRVPGYQFLQAYEFGNAVFGGSGVPAIIPSTLPNPNITWEVSKKLDIGLVAEYVGRTTWCRPNVFSPRSIKYPVATQPFYKPCVRFSGITSRKYREGEQPRV